MIGTVVTKWLHLEPCVALQYGLFTCITNDRSRFNAPQKAPFTIGTQYNNANQKIR